MALLGLRCSAALPVLARENLLQEAKAETMDAILMLGDHAYNWAMGDERRGDGYMDAFSPVISEVPWLPVIGK